MLFVVMAPLETGLSVVSRDGMGVSQGLGPALLLLPLGPHVEAYVSLLPGRQRHQVPRSGKRRKASRRAPSPAAHKLLTSHSRAELRLSWGAFCTGISQMSRGLTVLIKHLENLAGSPLHYASCSRMFSGVLPLLCLLSELLPSSMSPFAHLERPSLLVQMGKQLFQTLGAQECPSIIRHTTNTMRWWGGHGEAEKAG